MDERMQVAEGNWAVQYRAVQSRDTRFDGQFVFAVSSTGIYCRPSCPARTPKPENVRFFSTSAAAHEAGYRACKRCLPEATSGTPEWNLRHDLVGRAMRLIRDGVMNDGGVEALSQRLGYSPRHLTRALREELGAGPAALARIHRAQTARSLLLSTDLTAAEIAFASGFGSVRQFNDTMRTVFDATPRQIRARRRPASAPALRNSGPAIDLPGHPGAPEPALTVPLALPVRHPFDAHGVFTFLAERALSGMETAQIQSQRLVYARTLWLPHGPGAVEITAVQRGGRWDLYLRCELTSLADTAAAVAAARRLMDLDADPEAVDTALSRDPHLAAAVGKRPGIRLPGSVDAAEYLVRAIAGQQISVRAARGHLTRMEALLGRPYASSFPGLDRLFPTMEDILAGIPEQTPGRPPDPERPLRLPARSIRTIRIAAQAVLDGTLDLHPGVHPEALRKALVELPGIGEWTAAYLLLRTQSHPDVWMTGDVALIAGAKALGLLTEDQSGPPAHRALAEQARRWAPWRSYAAMHLWASVPPPAKGQRP
ncbi:DNA-3-methyladenine glycosylase 2 family protein [Nesterenkonia flava]|uniref:DNA-3-methyladenine glycosylase II n=1 Tax=Nesterenkonia flava TaxID=469799 RepID=A0ABU1FRM8_9MICC|nr:Ada metal-binding domain-containing protein [Nesterenkonia flava]MDR5711306.1 Ada metal-binding domain-containing protein [Nesterenkonia flava]